MTKANEGAIVNLVKVGGTGKRKRSNLESLSPEGFRYSTNDNEHHTRMPVFERDLEGIWPGYTSSAATDQDAAGNLLLEMKGDVQLWKQYINRIRDGSRKATLTEVEAVAIVEKQLLATQQSIKEFEAMLAARRNVLPATSSNAAGEQNDRSDESSCLVTDLDLGIVEPLCVTDSLNVDSFAVSPAGKKLKSEINQETGEPSAEVWLSSSPERKIQSKAYEKLTMAYTAIHRLGETFQKSRAGYAPRPVLAGNLVYYPPSKRRRHNSYHKTAEDVIDTVQESTCRNHMQLEEQDDAIDNYNKIITCAYESNDPSDFVDVRGLWLSTTDDDSGSESISDERDSASEDIKCEGVSSDRLETPKSNNCCGTTEKEDN